MYKATDVQRPEDIVAPTYEVRMKNAREKKQEKYDKLTSNAFWNTIVKTMWILKPTLRFWTRTSLRNLQASNGSPIPVPSVLNLPPLAVCWEIYAFDGMYFRAVRTVAFNTKLLIIQKEITNNCKYLLEICDSLWYLFVFEYKKRSQRIANIFWKSAILCDLLLYSNTKRDHK
jgi:hypothetical protein